MSHVVVLGGGITGMAAAWYLRRGERAPSVTLVEASGRLGGKILTTPFTGLPVDEGPDSFLARVPAALDLCRELGLAGGLVSPATGRAFLWTRGRLRPLPEGLVLGVPSRMLPLARSRVLSAPGLARAALEPALPRCFGRTGGGPPGPAAAGADQAVGHLVRGRFGYEVHERLVDPLLGGINAARTEELSLETAAPHLAEVARRHRSLVLGLRARRAAATEPGRPAFYSLPAGMGTLVERLAWALVDRGVHVVAGTAAVALDRAADGGYLVRLAGGAEHRADAVVVAVPAPAAAGLLAGLSPAAAAILGAVEYSSVGVVTLAYPAGAARHPLDGSGFLVPRGEGRLVTACTWMSSKWAALARPDAVVIRASVGRWGDTQALSLDDGHLVDRVHGELRLPLGIGAAPTASRVSRWPASLPQYRPGHLARMAEVDDDLAQRAPGVVLAGAAYRGVGIPTCVRGARAAAEAVLLRLVGARGTE